MNRRVFAFAVLLGVNLLGTATVCYLTFVDRREAYYEQVAFLLRAATAYGEHVARIDLPAAPLTTRSAPLEDAMATKYFTDYASATQIANLYTMIEDDRGQVLFTESSAHYAHPGQVYTSAPSAVHEAFRTKQSTIASYKDQFGRWRSMFTPVQSAAGRWFVIGADIATEKVERQNMARLWNTIEIGAVGFVLTSLAGAFFLGKLVRRTGKLVHVMEDLVRADFTRGCGVRERLAELEAARHDDDVATVARAVASMEAALHGYVERLTATTAANERLESELKVAHDIQLGLLPKRFPPFPDRPEFELYALTQPAKEVGGDLYDFFWIDEDHLFFVIGDVSDKGVPAALFMAVTKTLLKTNMRDSSALAEALARVNDYLVEGNDSMMFVTVFAAILDVRTGELETCDGGHNAPYVLRRDGGARRVEKRTGLALGFARGFQFESAKITLDVGETIFLYTDGVTEARDAWHAQFSGERLEPALLELAKQPLGELLGGVMSRVSTFAASAPQSDDITMLALRFLGKARKDDATERRSRPVSVVATMR